VDTRRLILMRHAQAHPQEPPQTDFARPLTERGRRDAHGMGRLLVQRGWVPEAIVASPAERTAVTARIVATCCGLGAGAVSFPPELYHAGAEDYWRMLESQDAALRCVLICGHNPGLSGLASLLGNPAKRRELPTAGLVTGVWRAGAWGGLEPGTAADCEAAGPDD
jgi:phosphohistidine phosphatase